MKLEPDKNVEMDIIRYWFTVTYIYYVVFSKRVNAVWSYYMYGVMQFK